MTINFAIEYIPRKMKELGYGDNYTIRFRDFLIEGGQQLQLKAHGGEFFILVEDNRSIVIDSDAGRYLMQDAQNFNENVYEHDGNIQIANFIDDNTYVKMIQVIPRNQQSN